MPENGVPRKSLSFFLSSNRTVDNANQSTSRIRALGRAVSIVNASNNTTRNSSESQEGGESESSTVESPTQRLSFRVLNPDPHTSTSSTDSSRINNDSAYDNEDDEIVEEIHYKQDEDEIHLQEKTMISEDEMNKEEPTTTTPQAPPPTPLHALSTPPTTESSSSSPDMKKTPGDIGGKPRYSQGWKIIGSTPEEDELQQQPYQRHSKVMELEESLPPTPQLTTNRPRVSFDTMQNSSDGGSSASPLSPTSPTMFPMYPQQQQSPVIYQDPRRLRHPPRTTRSRPMAFIQQQQQQQQHLPLPPRQSFTSTYGHFISSSSSSLISPRASINTARKIQQHPITQSKYAKASYSLTNHPDAIKTYRSMAEKTRDPIVQLSYAKYLLEIADLYDGQQHTSNDATCSSTSVSSTTSQRLSLDGYDPANTTTSRTSLDTIRSAPSLSTAPTHRLSDASRRKKKMLQDEGVRWIKLLAKQNVGEAAYLQARWLDRGEYGFSKNPTKAFKLYKVAAAEFVPEAMYQVGRSYERSGNTMQALSNYQGAAEKDIVQAIYRMARIHLLGELGQRRNTFLGLELLTQAVDRATEQCPEPPYLLGLILTSAYPKVELSTELIHRYGGELAALRHIEHAAQLGYGPAQSRIAYIYEHGLYGAPMHFAKSFGYYDMAAREHNSPQAMLGLSRLYNRGCRGPADILTEEERLARDVSEWLSATTRNEDAAFRWCEKAADKGLDEAVFLLGYLVLRNRRGVLRDYERAKQLYHKAANKGHQGAVERLQKANSMTRQQHESTKRNIRTSSCVLM